MMDENWAYRIHKFSEGIQEKFGGLFIASYLNWEIWIENGARALPLRLAMTYKQASNFPRFMVEYKDWTLTPKLNADLFVFKAPARSKVIEFDFYQAEQKQNK